MMQRNKKIFSLIAVIAFLLFSSSRAIATTSQQMQQSQLASIGSVINGLREKLNLMTQSVLSLSSSGKQLAQVASQNAMLSLSPTSSTINVGETFVVTVSLDTKGASTDGAEIKFLNYDPSILEDWKY